LRVGGADLQRHDVVGETEHDRRRVQQQHDRAVHGEQLVVLLVRQELQTGAGELGAYQQRHRPAGQKEHERRHQIQDRDVLRIRRPQHPRQNGPRGRTSTDRSRNKLRHIASRTNQPARFTPPSLDRSASACADT
jgi:hypothetical protein